MPCVLICPYSKDDVSYIAFRQKNVVSQYQIFLVFDNAMVNSQSQTVNDFIVAMIDLFEPMNAAQRTAGAWDSKVEPSYDYDRSLFPVGYTVSCVQVNIQWLMPITR